MPRKPPGEPPKPKGRPPNTPNRYYHRDSELADFLTRYNLTQQQMADLIDVSKQTISRWINGHSELPEGVRAYMRVVRLLEPEDQEHELATKRRTKKNGRLL